MEQLILFRYGKYTIANKLASVQDKHFKLLLLHENTNATSAEVRR